MIQKMVEQRTEIWVHWNLCGIQESFSKFLLCSFVLTGIFGLPSFHAHLCVRSLAVQHQAHGRRRPHLSARRKPASRLVHSSHSGAGRPAFASCALRSAMTRCVVLSWCCVLAGYVQCGIELVPVFGVIMNKQTLNRNSPLNWCAFGWWNLDAWKTPRCTIHEWIIELVFQSGVSIYSSSPPLHAFACTRVRTLTQFLSLFCARNKNSSDLWRSESPSRTRWLRSRSRRSVVRIGLLSHDKPCKFNWPCLALERLAPPHVWTKYYPGQKKSLKPRNSWGWSSVQSCDIMRYRASLRHQHDSQCLRVASSCCMRSHYRIADQSHEYLGSNDFFGQGSSSLSAWPGLNNFITKPSFSYQQCKLVGAEVKDPWKPQGFGERRPCVCIEKLPGDPRRYCQGKNSLSSTVFLLFSGFARGLEVLKRSWIWRFAGRSLKKVLIFCQSQTHVNNSDRTKRNDWQWMNSWLEIVFSIYSDQTLSLSLRRCRSFCSVTRQPHACVEPAVGKGSASRIV